MAGADFLSRSLLPVSEVLIVALLGQGTCFILVYARPGDPVADLTAFLIVSAVLFSVIAMGAKIIEEMTSAPEVVPNPGEGGRLGDALFGYFSTLVDYLGFVAELIIGSPE
jgi:hypothetical protein